MRAIEKIYSEKSQYCSWINICMGKQVGIIHDLDILDCEVSEQTIRKQLRQDGFYTRKFGEEILFSKNKNMLY